MRSRDNVIQQTSAFKEKTYAESFTVVGSIKDIKCYQDQVNSIAPFFGHYPKAPKSHSKNEILTNTQTASVVIANTKVTLTSKGMQHLGVVIGSHHFKEKYVNKHVANLNNQL